MEFKNLYQINIKEIFLGGVVFCASFGLSYYLIYQYQEIKSEDIKIYQILSEQQQELLEIKQELGIVRFESEGKVEELKKKITAEEKLRQATEIQRKSQEQLAENKISNLEERLSQVGIVEDISSVIKNWEPVVAYIACDFSFLNSTVRYQTSGSGVVIKFDNEPIKVLTNRHVLYGPEFYRLNRCSVKLSGSVNEFEVPLGEIQISTSEYDWGTLIIKNPDENLNKVSSIFPKLCDQKPNLGDSVVVLGYPGIGSKSSITATEGIISGFDGSYFITSAKVEQGNSGGAAILSKNNCLLGIPTYASLGQVESLARILDIWTIVTK